MRSGGGRRRCADRAIDRPQGAERIFPPDAGGAPDAAILREPLTGRERRLLRSLSQGLSNREIAERLSLRKVQSRRVMSILQKGVRIRTEAAVQARHNNIEEILAWIASWSPGFLLTVSSRLESHV